MNEHYTCVTSYFNSKADQYDDVDAQLYWSFSDAFYKEVLKRELPPLLNSKAIHLLDAGAGTGRWTIIFDQLFGAEHLITGDLVDISEGMLEVARKKLLKESMAGRFGCKISNIEHLQSLADDQYDIAISFYNVLSFVEHPRTALEEILKKLKPKGVHVSIVASTYHAYYFAITTNQLSVLDLIQKESKVRFNNLMPAIHCFRPEELAALYLDAGFATVNVLGGPNFMYPGMDETMVHGQTVEVANKLRDAADFKMYLSIELEHYRNADLIGRANTLMAIAQK